MPQRPLRLHQSAPGEVLSALSSGESRHELQTGQSMMPISPLYLCLICLVATFSIARYIRELRREADMKNKAKRADQLERRLALIEETHRSSSTCHKPNCARENPPHAAFCSGCGASLTDSARRYHVVLIHVGSSQHATIKRIRKSLRIGLKEAKQLAEILPQIVGMRLPHEQAIQLAQKFRKVGARVDLCLAPSVD